jgi:hypothetical protein
MEGILTPEEKKVLRFVGRYLNSLGMRDGLLESEGFDAYDSSDLTDINVDEWTHFANNYSVEVPEQLYPILEKLLEHSQKRYDNIDIDTDGNDIHYARFEVNIDTEEEKISVKYWYTYYATGDGSSISYSEEDDDNRHDDSVGDILQTVRDVSEGLDIMELRYNGGGDSGYIEGTFENGEEVPAEVEDFCYRILEDNYGGWEINEGSQGSFFFDLNEKTITLEHEYNTEESKTYTLYEESFSK